MIEDDGMERLAVGGGDRLLEHLVDCRKPRQGARHAIPRGDEHGGLEHPPADLETDRLTCESVKKAVLLPHIGIVGQTLSLPLRALHEQFVERGVGWGIAGGENQGGKDGADEK